MISGWYVFEQVDCACCWMLRQDFGVTWVERVGRCTSLFNALLLAGEFERVPEQGDAEDAEGSGEWQVISYQ